MADDEHCRVMLCEGPQNCRVIDQDRAEPGITIVAPRMPDDGPMVEDLYLWSGSQTDGGLWLATFTGTRAIPEPDPELLEPGPDEQPESLAADLTPFLNWPLYFTYGVHCDRRDCVRGTCGAAHSGMVTARDFGTVRELLADIKAHAEGA